jgi:hypothetical protein
MTTAMETAAPAARGVEIRNGKRVIAAGLYQNLPSHVNPSTTPPFRPVEPSTPFRLDPE